MVSARAPVALAVSLVAAGCMAYYEEPLPSPTSSRPVPASGLRAGFGRADITPPPGVGLAGNGPEGRRAAGYRVRLYARALLLEDGTGERVALVVADLPQVTPNLHRLTALRIGDSRARPDASRREPAVDAVAGRSTGPRCGQRLPAGRRPQRVRGARHGGRPGERAARRRHPRDRRAGARAPRGLAERARHGLSPPGRRRGGRRISRLAGAVPLRPAGAPPRGGARRTAHAARAVGVA